MHDNKRKREKMIRLLGVALALAASLERCDAFLACDAALHVSVTTVYQKACMRQPRTVYSKSGSLSSTTCRSEIMPTFDTRLQLASDEQQAVPIGSLGPPEVISSLKIGDRGKTFRRTYIDGERTRFMIERVSYTPDCFVLRNFLSSNECDDIINEARARTMAPAETITNGDTSSRRHCDVAWIPSSGQEQGRCSSLVNSLVRSTADLFLSNHVLTDPEAGVEDLQVLRYDLGGNYVLHHDGEPRVLTIIYYLNGVGGTWFPLARTSNDVENDPSREINQDEMNDLFSKQRQKAFHIKAEALQIGQGYEPGRDGLVVKGSTTNSRLEEDSHVAWIRPGDAVAFYNYLDDGSARLDWRALHTGLATQPEDGVKWIANHWFLAPTLANNRHN